MIVTCIRTVATIAHLSETTIAVITFGRNKEEKRWQRSRILWYSNY